MLEKFRLDWRNTPQRQFDALQEMLKYLKNIDTKLLSLGQIQSLVESTNLLLQQVADNTSCACAALEVNNDKLDVIIDYLSGLEPNPPIPPDPVYLFECNLPIDEDGNYVFHINKVDNNYLFTLPLTSLRNNYFIDFDVFLNNQPFPGTYAGHDGAPEAGQYVTFYWTTPLEDSSFVPGDVLTFGFRQNYSYYSFGLVVYYDDVDIPHVFKAEGLVGDGTELSPYLYAIDNNDLSNRSFMLNLTSTYNDIDKTYEVVEVSTNEINGINKQIDYCSCFFEPVTLLADKRVSGLLKFIQDDSGAVFYVQFSFVSLWLDMLDLLFLKTASSNPLQICSRSDWTCEKQTIDGGSLDWLTVPVGGASTYYDVPSSLDVLVDNNTTGAVRKANLVFTNDDGDTFTVYVEQQQGF
ncbi:MAG: hypothetical protein LBN74_06315 [Prevotella sp.]|jgi:hypothetical protein|nr:hypothetical protein [Prevotella sp.]